jgi:hypothetical protein
MFFGHFLFADTHIMTVFRLVNLSMWIADNNSGPIPVVAVFPIEYTLSHKQHDAIPPVFTKVSVTLLHWFDTDIYIEY